MLFCVVLCCFVLFCFVLFCFVLFCFVLFCFVLFCLFVCLFRLLCVRGHNSPSTTGVCFLSHPASWQLPLFTPCSSDPPLWSAIYVCCAIYFCCERTNDDSHRDGNRHSKTQQADTASRHSKQTQTERDF